MWQKSVQYHIFVNLEPIGDALSKAYPTNSLLLSNLYSHFFIITLFIILVYILCYNAQEKEFSKRVFKHVAIL